MDFTISDSDGGYRIIELFYNKKGCAEMLLKLFNNQINLSSVKCVCPELKGVCFDILMKILVKTSENGALFGTKLNLNTEVALFISPESRETNDEELAIKKLKKLYTKYGFLNYDTKEELYRVSTLCIINEVVNNGFILSENNSVPKVPRCNDTTPPKINGKKEKKKESINIQPKKLEQIFDRIAIDTKYMASTISSRSKSRQKSERKSNVWAFGKRKLKTRKQKK